MKKIFIYLSIIIGTLLLGSCNQDLLDTEPTDSVSSEEIFKDPESAQVAINGIYKALFINGWSENWSDENPGMMALTLVKDLQGEDHLMAAQGQGWFFFDYAFFTDSDYTNTSGRQYSQWKFYYTVIAQANYIIANEANLVSYLDGSEGKNVVAQAYTLRAFAYMALYEWFCLGNYAVNSNSPGVPIYTEPTTTETKGNPRGTVAQVFEQVNADFTKAETLFSEANIAQANESHLDIYAMYALWARAAQITAQTSADWATVEQYANNALAKPGLERVATIKDLGGFNNCGSPNVLWGFLVIADQTAPYGPYLSHMDPQGGYGRRAFQCIDAWLWQQIPDTDARKTWWEDPTDYTYYEYNQMKFRYAKLATFTGDIIYLRAEEMILIAAEAACRQGNYQDARNLLQELGDERDTDYATRLAARTNASTYNDDTRGAFTTLMDEILFQRRIELWCEGFGRAYDLRRLDLGYVRDYPGSNHTYPIDLSAGDYYFVTLIPQKEFDSNPKFTVADQNPR